MSVGEGELSNGRLGILLWRKRVSCRDKVMAFNEIISKMCLFSIKSSIFAA